MGTSLRGNALCLAAFLLPIASVGQLILNGDFEINNATPGSDAMEMNNAVFNATVPDCFSFAAPSLANLDLITTPVWGGAAWSGDWFVGLSSTDRLSMELSGPLVVGQTYQVSFYDRARAGHCVGPVSIGVAMGPAETGTLIYNAPFSPVVGEWKLRVFSFVAPIAANYITVRMFSNEGCWEHIDDFCLSADQSCTTPMVIEMPNVFTPNADGLNDRFTPIEVSEIVAGSLEIYNRWGQLIFVTDNLNNGWDGTSNERTCADGIYFYRIDYTTVYGTDGSARGSITLLSRSSR